jgi:endonuclease YncB( thermonuclease family)
MPDTRALLPQYKKLVSEISSLYEGARKALVEAYWQIGRRIVEVEQQGAIKAAYGSGLLAKLSEDLSKRSGPGFSERNLERMRAFYLTHPKSTAPSKLTWSQYSELIPVKNAAVRKRLEAQALTEGLTHKTLRQLVRHEKVREQVEENLAATPETREPPDLLPVPKLGPLNTYSLVDSGDVAWPEKDVLLFDHGFKGYRTLTSAEKRGLKAGDIVEWTGVKLLKVRGATKPGYTYKAFLKEVIDGDTLWAVLDIGMRGVRREKLRLRGIDCPELNTVEGQKAKKFVEKILEGVPSLTVLSSKNATYDRYEADVFYPDPQNAGRSNPPGSVADNHSDLIYLNNLLLEQGYAIRVYE